MPPNNSKKLPYENITKTYKKSTNHVEHAVNTKAKHIARNIKLDDWIESLAKTPAFITHAIELTLQEVSWEKSVKLY